MVKKALSLLLAVALVIPMFAFAEMTTYIGEVEIEYGFAGDRKLIRAKADPNSDQLAAVDPGSRYPCYGVRRGTTFRDWYYIYVEEQDVWGWISSANATLYRDGSTGSSNNTQSSFTRNQTVRVTEEDYIGEVEVQYGYAGDRKLVRAKADPNSDQLAAVDPGSRYPCYGVRRGTTFKDWYYIHIEELDIWGWISSANATLYR